MSDEGRAPRGWASLYAIAFVMVLVAAGALVAAVRAFLQSTGWLWVSTWFSAAAIVVAIASLVLPRRR